MFLFAAALLVSSLGDLKLQSGQVIEDCKLSYRIHGQLNADRSNAVLFPTWFNGTTEDLEKYIGAKGLVDDSKYYVITVDALSNGVSSSPSNSPTQRAKAFPRITIPDMVESEHILLTQKLGIQHVYAVMGISMGGMQTFQWMTTYPTFMDRATTIVGTPRMGEKDIILWTSFMKGMNLGKGPAPNADGSTPKKSMLSQLIGAAEPMVQSMLTPQALQQLTQVFHGGNEPGHTPPPAALPPAADGTPKTPVALPIDKNPEDVLHQFEAMVVHDISIPYGRSLDKAATVIKARTLVINSAQDQAVSPGLPQQFADKLKAQKFMMTGPCGHNAYKPDCEEPSISPIIQTFFDHK